MTGLTYFSGVHDHIEAKARYRDLAMEHHPDRARQIMQAINAEYDRVKHMSDAELRQQSGLRDNAVSHPPRREREARGEPPSRQASAPPPSPKSDRKEYVYAPSKEAQAAIAEQQRLMNLPVPSHYTMEQRRAYDTWQKECAQRAKAIYADYERWHDQEEIDRQQAEERAAIARKMR